VANLVGITLSISFTCPQPLRGSTTLLPIIYFMTFHKAYIQVTFFSGFLNGSFKIETFVVLRFWMLISFSNKIYLKHYREISSNPRKGLSNGVLHAPIKDHLTLVLKGFVIKSQNFNLILDLSFYHNLCNLGLN